MAATFSFDSTIAAALVPIANLSSDFGAADAFYTTSIPNSALLISFQTPTGTVTPSFLLDGRPIGVSWNAPNIEGTSAS